MSRGDTDIFMQIFLSYFIKPVMEVTNILCILYHNHHHPTTTTTTATTTTTTTTICYKQYTESTQG